MIYLKFCLGVIGAATMTIVIIVFLRHFIECLDRVFTKLFKNK
jgi:uncharacterized membrane protein